MIAVKQQWLRDELFPLHYGVGVTHLPGIGIVAQSAETETPIAYCTVHFDPEYGEPH